VGSGDVISALRGLGLEIICVQERC